jgi:hypothetical protein
MQKQQEAALIEAFQILSPSQREFILDLALECAEEIKKSKPKLTLVSSRAIPLASNALSRQLG